MLKHIAPGEVRLGMYIQSFDGQWLAHPFWRSRFTVTDPTDLLRLQASKVRAIVIDDEKGIAPASIGAAGEDFPIPACVANDRVPDRLLQAEASSERPDDDASRPLTRYVPSDPNAPRSAVAERGEIVRVLGKSAQAVRQVFDSAVRGHSFPVAALTGIVDDLSEAMTSNRTLMIRVSRLKTKDEYTFSHSVAVGALMLGFARELGLDEDVVRELTLAGLVHDVGKMQVDEAILKKPGPLTDTEFAEMRRHPELGHRILAMDDTISPIVLDVTLRHHERLDGSGYPGGLTGDQLSLHARIAGICDVFDALTSARAYKEAMPAQEAITMMASWEGQFDRDLLLVFMRSIGLYPAGMLVRLSSQRLGVVLPPVRRAGRPRVRVFHCAMTDTPLPPCDVVISENARGEVVVAEEWPDDWSIEDWPTQCEHLLRTSARRAA